MRTERRWSPKWRTSSSRQRTDMSRRLLAGAAQIGPLFDQVRAQLFAGDLTEGRPLNGGAMLSWAFFPLLDRLVVLQSNGSGRRNDAAKNLDCFAKGL